MLAKSVCLPDSLFSLLPNPTQYRWETSNDTLELMAKAFIHQTNLLTTSCDSVLSLIQSALLSHAEGILDRLERIRRGYPFVPPYPDLEFKKRLQNAVNDATEVLVADIPQQGIKWQDRNVRAQYTIIMLRTHVELVLAALDQGSTTTAQDQKHPVSDGVGESEQMTPLRNVGERAETVDLGPEKLMELYFQDVRPKAIAKGERRIRDIHQYIPKGNKVPDTKKVNASGSGRQPPLRMAKASCEDIWCALVFRSIVWLMLHHFRPDDLQLPNSDLMRLKNKFVYIA